MVVGNVAYFGISLAAGLLSILFYKWANQKQEPHKQGNGPTRQSKVKSLKLSKYEKRIAADLVDPRIIKTTWTDIAGLDNVIAELKGTVILPVEKRQLFQGSTLLQPPKGVLLHGPPGCGKTLIAKATAKEAGFCFINLQVSTLTDKFYGESEKLAAAVFSLAVKLQPTIIFIDEIDSFLRSRSSSDHEVTARLKAQFMSLWDGLVTDHHCQVLIMGATNRRDDLDPAILRRMPTQIHIKLPSVRQREDILGVILKNEKVDPLINLRDFAMETEGFSGSDLKEMCREAALLGAGDLIHSQNNVPSDDSAYCIRKDDFHKAISKFKESKNGEQQDLQMMLYV
ncbi:ATPase family AAA domain-containing protein 1-B-like [Archocentrus centrarchus]|uniref:ATPase family AAA domain-containing protein 1-B-like n=1 Tax=Archocentrus centrarchus TaxID=63155 RepID=UPI0011E9FEBF|nr:ATPase family AAA domain-containing protein 1-B-like [Archocentrus centrarchus]